MKPMIYIGLLFLITLAVLWVRNQQLSMDTSGVEQVDVNQAKRLINDKKVKILDVRTPSEYQGDKIPGATNINVMSSDFSDKVSTLDTTQSYVVYCRSGRRSLKACGIMSRLGFGELYNLKGGIQAWKQQQ